MPPLETLPLIPGPLHLFPSPPVLLAPSVPACGARVLVSRVSACVFRAKPRATHAPSRVKRHRLVFSGGSHLPCASPPRGLCGYAMASSSSQQGAREAPPPDQLASLYSLTDKAVNAGALRRHARSVELSALAALKAEASFTDDSLVVAYLRMNESKALASLAATERGAEQAALCRRSWDALLSVLAILQHRLAADTLLPGTVRKEESDYYAHVQAVAFAAQNEPLPSTAALQNSGSTIGCSVLLGALYRSLNFASKLFQSWWPDAQRKVVESFVRPLLSSSLLLPLTLVPTGRLCSGISSPGLHPSHSLYSWSLAQPI